MKELPTLYTASDVAEMAKRSVATIHRWVNNGWLVPQYRLTRSNQVLFTAEEVGSQLPSLLLIAEENPRRRGRAAT
jgi:hypothetical protein